MRLNKRFGIRCDKYNWILDIYREGKDKDGNPKEQKTEQFFGQLEHVAGYILNVLGESCESLDDLIELYTIKKEELTELLVKEHSKDEVQTD